MAEYIEREAFKAEILRLSTHYLNEWDTLGVLAAADRIPAADVRPVVRCGECKKLYECRFSSYLGLTGFCSWGERITNCGADMRGCDA